MRIWRLSFCMILAVIIGVVSIPQFAMANERTPLYVNGEKENPSGGGTIRVAMRNAPSSTADVICRIYNGIEVDQISPATNGFTKIRLGDVEGYMTSKYLAKAGQEVRMPNCAYASIETFGNDPEVCIFSDSALTRMEQSFASPLSAIVYAISSDWAYIQPLTSGEWEPIGKPGYVSAEYVQETQNFQYGWVEPAIKGDTLKLYAGASEKNELLGEYYAGAYLSHMYWDSVDTDWMKVRFGHTVGYVKKGNHYGGFPAEIPELQAMRIAGDSGALKLRPDENSETLLTLKQGTTVYLIGFTGDWYHVQTDTFFNNPQFGYVHKSELVN